MLIAVNHEPLVGLTFDNILEKVTNAKHPRTLSFSKKPREAEASRAAEDQLPLPDDFFADLAPLTEEDEKEVRQFMDAKLLEALKLAYAEPESIGLELLRESHGVTIHSKKLDTSDVKLVRARTQVPIAADLFMYAALAPESSDFQRIFQMLDPMFRDGKVLHKIPKTWTRYKPGAPETAENVNLPLYSIKWAAFALPFPLWYRDFVWAELTCWAPDGSGVSMAMSIPKITAKVPSLEDSHKMVRGNIGMSGYIWKNIPGRDPNKPEGENHMMCEITYLLQIEVGGNVPPWAVNLTGVHQGMNCLRVVGYAEEQRKLVKFMYDKNIELNRTEVRKYDIPQGETREIKVLVPKGKELVFDWCLEANDIGFSVRGPSGTGMELLIPHARQNCNLSTNPYYGRVTAKETGVHSLIFDNSHSWFTSKRVYLHYLVLL